MPPRPCLTCGKPTAKTRCPTCARLTDRQRTATRPHLGSNWDQLSRKLRAQWVAEHGWVCPGWDTPPHPSTDLTVDHVTARDPTRLAILCRSCNSRKSATERKPRR